MHKCEVQIRTQAAKNSTVGGVHATGMNHKKRGKLSTAKESANPSLRFHELLELWLGDIRISVKESTIYRYRYLVDTHISPDLGMIPLDKLSAPQINNFLLCKMQNGKLDGSGGLSPSYVKSIARVICSALRYGSELGYCDEIWHKIKKPTVQACPIRILSKEQQKRLEQELLQDTDGTKLGIYISLYTGLRIGEVCALGWDDIDLLNNVIHVNGTVTRISGKSDSASKTALVIDTPKTHCSARCVPICSKLSCLLQCHASLSASGFVVSEKETFISPRTYDYRFRKILSRCGIADINYHSLRHTFASRCIESGVDVKSLSEVLGHANAAITLNTYVHSSLELKRQQLEKLIQQNW